MKGLSLTDMVYNDFLDRSNQKTAISQNIEDLIMDFTSILHPGDRFKEPFECREPSWKERARNYFNYQI